MSWAGNGPIGPAVVGVEHGKGKGRKKKEKKRKVGQLGIQPMRVSENF
jgi:hypothetical protein